MKTIAIPLLLLALTSVFCLIEAASAESEPNKLKKEAPFCDNCKARPPQYLVGKRQRGPLGSRTSYQDGQKEELLFPGVWNLDQEPFQPSAQPMAPPPQDALMLRELLRGRSLLRGSEDELLYSNKNEGEMMKKQEFCKDCQARRLDYIGTLGQR